MRIKDFQAQVKTTGTGDNGLAEGEFEAIVAVFGNTDSSGVETSGRQPQRN